MRPPHLFSITLRARLALFPALCVLAACVLHRGTREDSTAAGGSVPMDASGGDSVQIVADQPTYHPGDMVALRLVNRTSTALGYNACLRTLQRNRIGVWLNVSDTGRVCTMQIQMLPAGSAQVARTVLDRSLAPAEYRVVIRFSLEKGATTQWIAAASNGFRVE